MKEQINKLKQKMQKIKVVIDNNQKKYDDIALEKFNLENKYVINRYRTEELELEEFDELIEKRKKGDDKRNEKTENN